MTRPRLTLLSVVLLLLTTPILTDKTRLIWGFPTWSLITFTLSVVYAAAIALLLHRYWGHCTGDVEQL
ncbi:MAG: hypothetical protein CME19_15565 [Gemmatimonadetes bacterium]|nr:hypothetical protein [Gemmatimonadota bacterium]